MTPSAASLTQSEPGGLCDPARSSDTSAMSSGISALSVAPPQSQPQPRPSSQNGPSAVLLTALASVGARSLDDYLLDIELKAKRRRGSNSQDLARSEESTQPSVPERALQGQDGPTSSFSDDDGDGEDLIRLEEEEEVRTSPSGASTVAASSSTSTSSSPSKHSRSSVAPVDTLPLLTVAPNSRLGKRLCFTSTGQLSELFDFDSTRTTGEESQSAVPTFRKRLPVAVPTAGDVQTHPVSALNQFAQQAGLKPPLFTSVAKPGIHCSPDHYVTLVFEGHIFADERGQRSIKAGKELLAHKAIDFFFGKKN